jgi:hypothetical protein
LTKFFIGISSTSMCTKHTNLFMNA